MVTRAQAPALPRNPERTAWTVLVASFATFVILVSTLLFGGSWWLRNAAVDQTIAPVYSGAVQVLRPGRTAPEVNPPAIPVGSTVLTDPNVQSTLSFASSDGRSQVANIQIFGGSTVDIVEADSPRFSTSIQPHHIILQISKGRVRAFVGVDARWPVVIEIRSGPTAVTLLEVPGTNAEVEVTATESMVTVREGEATVQGNAEAVVLVKDQRTEVPAGAGPGAVVPAERNLILNGDFGDAVDGEWVQDIRVPEDPTQAAGTVDPVIIGGRRTMRFQRSGINWSQVGIIQTLDRDVRGYDTLRLHMEVLIAEQDLPNCGGRGSECPLMAKILYLDVYGKTQEWLQGFYYNYNPNVVTFCLACSPTQWQHEQWPRGQWKVYDSPNLLEIFEANETPAATIQSITLYASGHSYSSYVTDVQLLAE